MNTDSNSPRRPTTSGTGAVLSTTITVQVTEVSNSVSAPHSLSSELSAKDQEPAIIDRKLIESAFLAEALRVQPVIHWGINE